eukprot:1769771-Pleurochrysis_carterae.AAC.2
MKNCMAGQRVSCRKSAVVLEDTHVLMLSVRLACAGARVCKGKAGKFYSSLFRRSKNLLDALKCFELFDREPVSVLECGEA